MDDALRRAGYQVVTLSSDGDRFDAWAGVGDHRRLLASRHVLFVSDGLIGPFDFASFQSLLHDFEAARADVWAITDSYEHWPHLQTELLGFNHGVLRDPAMVQALTAPAPGGLLERELALDHAFSPQLVTTEPWMASARIVQNGQNSIAEGWRGLIARGLPLVARRTIAGAASLGQLDELAAAVRERFNADLDEWLTERDRSLVVEVSPKPPIPVEPPDGHWADFDRWVERRSLKLKADFPPTWRHHLDRDADHPRVAVLVHVYYPELFPELIAKLANLPVPFDLIVTNASGTELAIDAGLPELHRSIVLEVPNRGRDILPMATVVNAGLLDPYDLVLKLHTKRSAWRAEHADFDGSSGADWRAGFLDELIGSRQRVEAILGTFAADRRLGLLTSSGNLVGPEHWGGDEHVVRQLLRRLQLGLQPSRLRFPAGSMYWIRGFLLQGLRALDLSPLDFEPEHGLIDGTTAHALERIVGILTRETGYDLADRLEPDESERPDAWRAWLPGSTEVPRARVVPFYLPQFHTFPENDEWWGEGFTEWANVAAAQPVFPGHSVPLLPSELGFYDLMRDETVRPRQYALAQEAGLAGFMYYYYWFAGKTLMSAPVERLAASGDPHPFCLMWANENWTRTWDGGVDDILIAQEYEQVPATRFIHDVLPLLQDERYLRVDGKPLLAVYKLGLVPDHERVLAYWRKVAEESGLGGLHLVAVDVGAGMGGVDGDATAQGTDAVLEFAPHNTVWVPQSMRKLEVDRRFEGRMQSYAGTVRHAELKLLRGIEETRYPGIMVEFDNTARRQWRPDIWYGSNPYTFRRWLDAALDGIADRDPDHRIVFVNAWNEWAESAVLEPSQRWGRSYLQAARDAIVRLIP